MLFYTDFIFLVFYSRGKDCGHDVDILLTHPVEGKEKGILEDLLHRLDRQGRLIYGKREQSTWNDGVLQGENIKGQYLKSTLDHFEKWIGIMKLDKKCRQCCLNYGLNSNEKQQELLHSSLDMKKVSHLRPDTMSHMDPKNNSTKRKCPSSSSEDRGTNDRTWYARRVDLIVTPTSQFYYALVGWTGSKHFNRSLRLYAQKELHMKLTSHALYDTTKVFSRWKEFLSKHVIMSLILLENVFVSH